MFSQKSSRHCSFIGIPVTGTGRREQLHDLSGGSSASYLPESICDLNAARPVHLAVLTESKIQRGVKVFGLQLFVPYESHVLLAGKILWQQTVLEPTLWDSIVKQQRCRCRAEGSATTIFIYSTRMRRNKSIE